MASRELSRFTFALALLVWSLPGQCLGIGRSSVSSNEAADVQLLRGHRFLHVLAGSVSGDTSMTSVTSALEHAQEFHWFRALTRICAFLVLFLGIGIWIIFVPCKIFHEWTMYKETTAGASGFGKYLQYRFSNWVTKGGTVAMSKLILIGCITEVSLGGIAYWATTGESPLHGMWLVFLWMSASSVQGRVSTAEGILGGLATVGGLLMLALLLGTVTDYLAVRMQKSRAGRDGVVEGGHTLVLGYSSVVADLLKELADGLSAKEKQTIVLLGDRSKDEITKSLEEQHVAHLEVWNRVNLVTRSGQLDNPDDLRRVCAGEAARIVIPPDASMTREQADAQTFAILMTLSNLGMPNNGHVVARCAVARNLPIMENLHKDSFALRDERLGVMMTMSSRDHGLCQVFTQLIGFDGDEFYFHNAKAFGVAGKPFKDLAFCFPAGVPLGLCNADGEITLNPPQDREVLDDDQIIMLQEDEDSCEPFESEYFNMSDWLKDRPEASFCEENPNDQEKVRVLICNFQEQGMSLAVLFGLDDMCAEGSEVVLYTNMSEAECMQIVQQAQLIEGHEIQNFKVTVYSTRPTVMTSYQQIEDVMQEEFEHIFVLADACIEDSEHVRVDQKTLATVLQMKEVTESRGFKRFDPVVEICSSTAAEQLESWGVHNIVNSNLIMQKALAMLTVNKAHHGVLKDLMSAEGNCLDVQEMNGYMATDEELPKELNFGEATAIVQRASQQILVGWTHGDDYVLNPKDKQTPRAWEDGDRLLVIKTVDD